MRATLLLGLLLSVTLCSTLNADETAKGVDNTAKPLNIIMFLVDDLGWQDTSLPFHAEKTPLNRRYRTPNLERLAAQGMRFTHSYASAPVCTPTRTSIMTGQSPGRSGITYWTLHKDKDTSTHRPDLAAPPWKMNGLGEEDVTLPKLLRNGGYRTIHVGKAHFGAHGTNGGDPTNLGFDVNIAGHASGGPASFYGKHNFTLAGRQGKDPKSSTSVWDIPGLEKYHGQDIYLTEALAIEAVAAIEQSVKDGKPFYLNFAPYAVHAPIMANKKYLDHYSTLDAKEAAYATMIETVDHALGDLLAALDRLGIAESTVVIYSSDNGGLSAHARGESPSGTKKHTHNAPLRSGKGSAYEGGVRVPTVVRWPGVVKPGATCATPIISHDYFPTILSMAKVETPKSYVPLVDGQDLVPMLSGSGTLAARGLHWSQPHQWGARGPGIVPYTAIRFQQWKLIYFHPKQRFELYDLANDVGEAVDLAAKNKDTVSDLAERLDRWITSRIVRLSIDKATGRPIPLPGHLHQGSK